MTDHFSDPDAVSRYADGARQRVPGLADAHRMTSQLLAELVPDDGRVLVVGAGGGLELRHLAGEHSGWTFDGVDPSAEMLKLAETTIGPDAAVRTTLHLGYVADAPAGPFDGATSLLTLHFVEADERLRTLRQIHERLKPGAPLVTLHYSVPSDDEQRKLWLSRAARFAISSGVDPVQAERGAAEIARRLPILSPQQDEALLREAGFRDIGLFYAALAFRGWVARSSRRSPGR